MTNLSDKITNLWRSLEEKGTVYLFALIERSDLTNKWDLVVSSSWADGHPNEAIRLLSENLSKLLVREETIDLARVVVVPSRAPFVGALTSAFRIEGGRRELVNVGINGLAIGHAFLYRSIAPAPPVEHQVPLAPLAEG